MSAARGSNVGGVADVQVVNTDADMLLYDQLPPAVRRAMQVAWFKYGSDDMRMALADHAADVVAAMIRSSDVAVARKNPLP